MPQPPQHSPEVDSSTAPKITGTGITGTIDKPFNAMPCSEDAEKAVLACIALAPERCFALVFRHINQMKRQLGTAQGETLPDPPAGSPKLTKAKSKTVDACTKESFGFFYKTQHAVLYSALSNTYHRHNSCDLILVTQHLNDHDLIDQAGGPAAVSDLIDDQATTTVLHHYLSICTEKFMQRRALAFATDLRALALTPTTSETGDAFLRGIIAGRRNLAAIETIAINRGNLQTIALNTADTDPENVLNPLPELLADLNATPPHDPIFITGYTIPETLAHLSENQTVTDEDGEETTTTGRTLFSLTEINKHIADPRLHEILRGRWIVTLTIRDEANTEWNDLDAIHAFLKEQLDTARRLGLVHLLQSDLPTATTTSLRILSEQPAAELPEDLIWESGLIFYGANGGVNVREEILARRIVLQKQLMFCAGDFWIWTERGVWRKCDNSLLYLKKWLRAALCKTEGGLELITENRIKSVADGIKSHRFIEPEALNR